LVQPQFRGLTTGNYVRVLGVHPLVQPQFRGLTMGNFRSKR